MSETVTILPETHEATLCLRLSGMVTPEDFTRNFGDRVQQINEKYDHYNLFVLYDETFEGWSREAADLSFKNIAQFSPKARRIAYVNAPDSRILMMKMLQPIMHAEVRYFDLSDKQQAMAWIMGTE